MESLISTSLASAFYSILTLEHVAALWFLLVMFNGCEVPLTATKWCTNISFRIIQPTPKVSAAVFHRWCRSQPTGHGDPVWSSRSLLSLAWVRLFTPGWRRRRRNHLRVAAFAIQLTPRPPTLLRWECFHRNGSKNQSEFFKKCPFYWKFTSRPRIDIALTLDIVGT